MAKFSLKLSEDPKALDGALEWIDAEIEKAKRQRVDAEEVKKRIAPYRQEAIRKIKARKEAAAVTA